MKNLCLFRCFESQLARSRPVRTVTSHRAGVIRNLVPGALLVAGLFFTAVPVRAQVSATVTTLYNFQDSDSEGFRSSLAQGKDGNFYGTARIGGAYNLGAVLQVTPSGVVTIIYSFGTSNLDGGAPEAALTLGNDGSFYGTTSTYGAYDGGTIFNITPSGVLKTLYSIVTNNGDPYSPFGKLCQASDGSLYGTTLYGGTLGNYGTVFHYSAASGLTTIHAFAGGSDGGNPTGGIVEGNDGNFYGTTSQTIFQVTPTGAFTTLYTFNTNEGPSPSSDLVRGSGDNLYGTTVGGGSYQEGTLFQITPGGVLTTLYNFTEADGGQPIDGVILGADGNFYGVNSSIDSGNYGTIFQITPAGVFTLLYNFVYPGAQEPEAALVQGTDGSFYGTTRIGSTNDDGTVFKVTVNVAHPAFFTGQTVLGNGVYYLSFANGNYFGYYSFLTDANYIYHFDLGYEYVFDAADGNEGVYLYDFKSDDFFYTSPRFPFPYLYDFNLNSVVYYYPDPYGAGHYNTDGIRYFYVVNTGQIISK